MDIYNKYNRKAIQDRQIDTLIGLSKGLIADGKINQKEAEFLMNWLIQSRQHCESPIINNLLNKISLMLEDGILDDDESTELLSILTQITGEPSEAGEIAKTTTLPLNKPEPNIVFQDKIFCFTGTFASGTRNECFSITEKLGGIPAKNINQSLDYLVLGTYVTDSWIHESFGSKIEKAVNNRDQLGLKVAIISEAHWLNEVDKTISNLE